MATFKITQEASIQGSDLWQGGVEYKGQTLQYRYYDGYDGQEVYVLTEQGWEMVEVNIRESDALQQEYGMRIPVLALPDGREKGWPFTAAQIGRMLQSASS